MRFGEVLKVDLCNAINRKLIDYLMRFPFPYIDILREQIAACQITNEWYPDCYIIHFHRKKEAKQLPLWLPTVPQGCQVLKENGPLSCQLYIESGYVVQFEVVDMGMNDIDWEHLWSHAPIFDFEYDLPTICSYLSTEKLRISKIHVGQQNVHLNVESAVRNYTVCFWNCNILSADLLYNAHHCSINVFCSGRDNHRYLVKFDDKLVLECSLVCLQDGPTMGQAEQVKGGDKGTALLLSKMNN